MRILFLGNQNIFGEINSGGLQCSKRNYDLIKMSDEKNDVFTGIVWNMQDEKFEKNIRIFSRVQDECEALKAAFFLCKTYPKSEEAKILRFIEEVKPDIFFLDSSTMGKILNKIDPEIRKIVFFHNIESEYAKHKIKEEGLRYIPSYLVSYYNEKMAVSKADKIICLNRRDEELLYRKYGRKIDELLPVSFQDKFDKRKINRIVNDKRLLFIGSLFPPNYKGVRWFVEEVMSQLPDYELWIVGKNFEQKRKELERVNVKVIGTVENLEEYYYSASSIVMPIQYGDGMKVKTAEAMMYGITMFATDEALEGYNIKGIEGIYRCNSTEEFVASIKNAYEDRKLIEFNEEIRDYFLCNHETEHQKVIMERILQ